MSLKRSSDEAEAPDTAIIPHPSKKTTSLPSLLPTEAYPPPVPGAVLRCYMRNSAPSGSIFCMMWTHVDAGVYSTTSRSGRTSTGLGNVTLKSFHSESEMNKFVFRQISERQGRPGAKAFVDHPVPASLPVQAKPSGKGTKRKVELLDDIEKTEGYVVRLRLDAKGEKPRWYVVDYSGDNTGSLRFGGYNAEGERGKGADKPKTFTSNREAKDYFDKYVEKKKKEGYVVEDANTTTITTTTTTTTTTTITPTSKANLPEDLFPMILSYIGDPGTLVALGRVSWDFNAIVEERVEAMPWPERFYFDQGRKPCITLPEDLRNLNEDWDEQDKAMDPRWHSGSSDWLAPPPGIDKVLVQIMYQDFTISPPENGYYEGAASFMDCRALISPSNYEIAVAIDEAFRELSDTAVNLTHGNLTYVDSYGHEGFGRWDERLVYEIDSTVPYLDYDY